MNIARDFMGSQFHRMCEGQFRKQLGPKTSLAVSSTMYPV